MNRITRRSFTRLIALIACAPSLLATGCISVTSLANDFIASLTAIVNADPTAAYVADLELAIQSLKTAVAGWNGTSVNCALQSAANIAAQIIGAILPGSPVAMVAAVAIAGFDVLMSNLAPCNAPTGQLRAMQAKYPDHGLRNSVEYDQAHNAIDSARFWSKQHVFKAEFNQAAQQSHLSVHI